jgi:iron(III) transport system substrate-binding protein
MNLRRPRFALLRCDWEFKWALGWALTILLCPAAFGAPARVVIITPHIDSIRYEFGRAFAVWHREHFGESAEVEWRQVGGTSDALRFVQSEFARKPEGIGIDCFFGGGQEPFLVLAEKKLCLRYEPPPDVLSGIPQNFNGVDVYDPGHIWYGAVLSSFGILQNTRVQRLVGLPLATNWADLARPELFGWVGAGDPRNSGTMTVMFDSFLQYYGWERGWQIITQLAGNVRKFDRVSSTTAKDVTLGETAYALALDYYGFTQVGVGGRTNLTFALPQDFTTVNPDGLAILKGAPNLATAQHFIDFTLSEAGQKLWFLPRGYPGGAQKYGIERMSVRPDFYQRFKGVSNIEFSPFELKQNFRYSGQVARQRRDILPALIGALLVDTHDELKKAWRAVMRRGATPPDLAELGRAPLTEAETLRLTAQEWKDPSFRNSKKIQWQRWAQKKYEALAAGGGVVLRAEDNTHRSDNGLSFP